MKNLFYTLLFMILLYGVVCLFPYPQFVVSAETTYNQKINQENKALLDLTSVNTSINLVKKLAHEKSSQLADSFIKSRQNYNNDIDLNNTTTSDPLDYKRAFFKQKFSAVLSHFESKVSFALAEFLMNVEMPSAVFFEKANFRWANFQSGLNLSRSRFKEEADFYSSIFAGEESSFYGAHFNQVSFANTQFRSKMDFSGVVMKGSSRFYKSTFFELATFKTMEFKGDVDFSYVDFNSDVNFENVNFGQQVSFSHSKFLGNVNFYNARMPEYLDFSGVNNVAYLIDFTNTRPHSTGKKCRVNLIEADLNKLQINYQQFQLYFPPRTTHLNKVKVYEGLLNNFKLRGINEDYRSLSIEYEKYKYTINDNELMSLVQDYWWDYGFKKDRIFMWIAVLIITFTLINNLFIFWLMENAFEISFLQPFCLRESQSDTNPVIRYILNLPLAFIYTLVIIFGVLLGFKHELEQFKTHNVIINLYLFFTMAVGLVCAMFILNYLVK